MRKLRIAAIAVAVAFGGTGAMAAGMTKDDYKSGRAGIASEFKADQARCDSFSANAKQVCIAEAKGREGVAKAELEAAYKPSHQARYDVSVARADAGYRVGKEKCDDSAGNAKDICVKEARAMAIANKADAKALLKTGNANDKAAETSARANKLAKDKGADARGDAASDKRDAEYAVAKEKCDRFANDAKTACIKDAKARFGQS